MYETDPRIKLRSYVSISKDSRHSLHGNGGVITRMPGAESVGYRLVYDNGRYTYIPVDAVQWTHDCTKEQLLTHCSKEVQQLGHNTI